MKWNWGTAIFLFFVLFVGACIAFIIFTQRQKWNMVEDNYYEKELRHEEKLVKMRNSAALSGQVTCTLSGDGLEVAYPADLRGETLTGTLHVYRPSDETLDVLVDVNPDTSFRQHVPASRLKHGKYIVKLDYKAGGKAYYQEKEIFVP